MFWSDGVGRMTVAWSLVRFFKWNKHIVSSTLYLRQQRMLSRIFLLRIP